MLRGSVVLFTGIFSVIFLGRRLYAFHWIGMILVLTGTAIVGIASVLEPDDNAGSASNPLLGDIIIVFAQIITAVQMVRVHFIKFIIPLFTINYLLVNIVLVRTDVY